MRIIVDSSEVVLSVRGRWTDRGRGVAIVGARAASRASLDSAASLASEAVRAGYDVISGGAFGVDAAAHRGALSAALTSEARTVVVFGTGIDVVYPKRHAALFDEIVASGGACVSQFRQGTMVHPGQFVARNAVIAALAQATVVIEAARDSGSLHTARAARRMGRKLGAIGGSAGTDCLLSEGAQEIFSSSDLIAWLKDEPCSTPRQLTLVGGDADSQRLYAVIERAPRDLGMLAALAGLSVAACAARLIDLEVAGFIRRTAGGQYLRLR